MQFDEKVVKYSNIPQKPITWVNWMGTSLEVSSGLTVQEFSEQYIHRVIHGEELANPRPSLPVGLPPPPEYFRNSPSCKLFANFVKKTLLECLRTGAISLKGRISEVELPHLVLPLTVEPTKPRLCRVA